MSIFTNQKDRHKNRDLILTWVDSLEASVISRFPLRPRSAGTRIKISETSTNTGQCYSHTNTHMTKNNYRYCNRACVSKMRTAGSHNGLKCRWCTGSADPHFTGGHCIHVYCFLPIRFQFLFMFVNLYVTLSGQFHGYQCSLGAPP